MPDGRRLALISPRRTAAFAATTLIGLLWVLPFVLGIAERPMLFFYSEWTAAALALLAGAYGFLARRQAWTIPAGSLVLAALAAWCALQPWLVRLPYAQPSYAYAAYLVWAAFLVALGRALCDELGPQRLLSLLAAFALAGGVLGACTGLVQKYGGPDWLELICVGPTRSGEVYGNIRHRSYFADHILLGLVGGLHLVAAGRLRARWLLLLSVPMTLAMGLAVSRATLLCLLLLLLPVGWQAWRRMPRAGVVLGVLSLVVLAYVAMPWVLPHLEPWARIIPASAQASIFERLGNEQDVAGLGVRLTLWWHALSGVASAPLLGVGPDGFAWQYFSESTRFNALPYTIHSHNLPLQVALSFGFPAALVLTLWLLGWLRRAASRLAATPYLFLAGSLLVIGSRAMLDLPLWIAPFLGIAALLIGVVETRGLKWRTPVASGRRRATSMAWGLCLLLGAATLLNTMHSYRHAASLWTERQSPEVLTQRYRKARENIFLTPVVDSVAADAMKLASRAAPRTLALNTRVMRWRPYSRVVYRQAAFLALNHRWPAACALLEKAVAVYPNQLDRFRAELTGIDGPGQPLEKLAQAVERARAGGALACQG